MPDQKNNIFSSETNSRHWLPLPEKSRMLIQKKITVNAEIKDITS